MANPDIAYFTFLAAGAGRSQSKAQTKQASSPCLVRPGLTSIPEVSMVPKSFRITPFPPAGVDGKPFSYKAIEVSGLTPNAVSASNAVPPPSMKLQSPGPHHCNRCAALRCLVRATRRPRCTRTMSASRPIPRAKSQAIGFVRGDPDPAGSESLAHL